MVETCKEMVHEVYGHTFFDVPMIYLSELRQMKIFQGNIIIRKKEVKQAFGILKVGVYLNFLHEQ